MARPVGSNSEETKRQILIQAIRLFGQRGLKATTLKAIAAECGVTFATIHHYFGNKLSLFHAALEASYQELTGLQLALAEALIQTPGSLAEKVEHAVRRWLEFARAHPDATRFLLRATLYEPEAQERTSRSQAEYLDSVSAVLATIVGRPAQELRVPLQGLMFLLTRVAAMDATALNRVGGSVEDATPESAGQTAAALTDYVVRVAVHTLTEHS